MADCRWLTAYGRLPMRAVMVFIVCHELLPAAHKYMANGAKTTMWLIIGMVIMAVSLVLFVL